MAELKKRSPSELAGFNRAPTELDATEAGSAAAISREQAEVQASIVVAKNFPRIEAECFDRLMRSCKRPTFAEGARYVYPRGGKNIDGPSVYFAREAARCWGNIAYGLRIVSETEEYVHIQGFASDRESNLTVCAEDKFKKLIQRKFGDSTRWVKPDERDARELINRRGAICVRNAILQLIPPDITEDCVHAIVDTLSRAAKGEIDQDKDAGIRRLVSAFRNLGVSAEMMQSYLGHSVDLVSEKELTDLRGIYASISDGNSRVDEYFAASKPKREVPQTLDDVVAAAEPPKPKSKPKRGRPKKAKSEAVEQPPPNDPADLEVFELSALRFKIIEAYKKIPVAERSAWKKNVNITLIDDIHKIETVDELKSMLEAMA